MLTALMLMENSKIFCQEEHVEVHLNVTVQTVKAGIVQAIKLIKTVRAIKTVILAYIVILKSIGHLRALA